MSRLHGLLPAACVLSLSPLALAAVDGTGITIGAKYSLSLAQQNTPTSFGDNFSELDRALGQVSTDGSFQLGLSGNLESGGNGLVIFLDTKAGGAVASTTAGGYGVLGSIPSGDNASRSSQWGTDTNNGVNVSAPPGGPSILSPGFNPDAALEISTDGTNYYAYVLDLTLPNDPPGSGPDNRVLMLADPGNSSRSGGVGAGAKTSTYFRDGGATNAGTVTHAFNNSNAAGVNGIDRGDPPGPLGDPTTATKGFEFLFSSLFLNADPGQEIKLLPFISNFGGDYLANQFLPGLPGGNLDSLGGPGGDGGTPLFDAEAGFAAALPNFYITVPLPEWAGGSGGWSTAANWLVTNPNGVNTTAKFGAAGVANLAVDVDANKTLGGIVFDGGASYVLSGAGSITMDAFAGKTARINVVSGNPTINVPILVNRDLRLTVANGSDTLNLAGPISYASGLTLTKDGAGTAVAQNVRVNQLDVQAGKMKVAASGTANASAGTSIINGLSVAASAQLDLTNNSLIVDYTAVGMLVNDTRLMLADGRLATSATGGKLGYADNAVLHLTSFGGQTVDDTNLLVKFTYGGDANLDGQVDISDLGALATAWQTSSVWTGGDFDYSGFVDISDLGILATNWQLGVGAPLGASFDEALAPVGLTGASVPEPTVMSLLALGLAGVASRRRRP